MINKIEKWGEDPETFNVDGDGAIGIGLFAKAIQVWALQQEGFSPTIKEAAKAFNCSVANITDAVEYHPYMFLSKREDGELIIDHDGE